MCFFLKFMRVIDLHVLYILAPLTADEQNLAFSPLAQIAIDCEIQLTEGHPPTSHALGKRENADGQNCNCRNCICFQFLVMSDRCDVCVSRPLSILVMICLEAIR